MKEGGGIIASLVYLCWIHKSNELIFNCQFSHGPAQPIMQLGNNQQFKYYYEQSRDKK